MTKIIGIYKIENLINHKIYVGQSIHIERRWNEHCFPSTKSIISKAIKKYGKENFSFQVLEQCSVEELDEREVYFIQQFNCVIPNGYNIKDYVNHNETMYNNYTKETLLSIISDIKNTSMSFQDIGKKYNITKRLVYFINNGEVHKLSNETYPLRTVMNFSKKNWYCADCGKEIFKGAKRCVECANKAQRTTIRPTREELKNLIRSKNFSELGKFYNVSDNTIRKWCKHYNLPSKCSDIKKIDDTEWLLI